MQSMIIGYTNKPIKSDLKPFDIVRNKRGDTGIVSPDGLCIRFSDHNTPTGATYSKTLRVYGENLGYVSNSSSGYSVVDVIRLPPASKDSQ